MLPRIGGGSEIGRHEPRWLTLSVTAPDQVSAGGGHNVRGRSAVA